MRILTLLKWRRFRIICYFVIIGLFVLRQFIIPERNTIPLKSVFSDPIVPEKMGYLLGGFNENTMNTSFNQFFDKEYTSIWKRHKSAYSRLVKKWVYNPEYHQRFSSYFSSMIKDYSNEECSSFRRVYPPKNDIMKNVFIESFSEPSFTAIFITNHARLHMIPTRIQQWKGPIIFVIYISTESQASVVSQFLLAKDFPEQVQIYTYEGKEGCFDNKHFPINKLRNMAIQYVQTTHYIVLDMDVSLSENVYSILMKQSPLMWEDYRSIVILPVFFLTNKAINLNECRSVKNCTENGESIVPKTKVDLKKCLGLRRCRVGKDYIRTHDYIPRSWFSDKNEIEKMNCFPYKGIEPYVILRRHPLVPLFDPAFYDYGGNKQILIERLRFFSNQWYILKEAFGVDLKHPKSDFRLQFDEEYTKNMNINPFLVELRSYELRMEKNLVMPIC